MVLLDKMNWIQEVLENISDKEIEDLFSFLPMQEIVIKKNPFAGLIMMKVKDTFDTEFYMGEVLVTQAEVMFHKHCGYSMILGEDLEKALLLATIDACLRSDQEQDLEFLSFIKKLEEISQQHQDEKQIQEKMVMQTKVNFKTF